MIQDKTINEDFETYKKELLTIVNATVKKENLSLAPHIIHHLAVHLAVALIRLKSNTYIPLSQGQIASYKMNKNYQIAVDLCDELKLKYHIQFPESEEALISMYLSKLDTLDVEFNSGLNLLDDDIYDILTHTFQTIFEKTGCDFRNDEKLLIGLGLHLSPAIERLLNDDQIYNPLLDKIKARHKKEFDMAQIINDEVEKFYQKRFIDEEVAYLALHFLVSIKNDKRSL